LRIAGPGSVRVLFRDWNRFMPRYNAVIPRTCTGKVLATYDEAARALASDRLGIVDAAAVPLRADLGASGRGESFQQARHRAGSPMFGEQVVAREGGLPFALAAGDKNGLSPLVGQPDRGSRGLRGVRTRYSILLPQRVRLLSAAKRVERVGSDAGAVLGPAVVQAERRLMPRTRPGASILHCHRDALHAAAPPFMTMQ